MKKIILLLFIGSQLVFSQIPIGVSRTVINNRGLILLPPISFGSIGMHRNGNETAAWTPSYSSSGSSYMTLSTNTYTSMPNFHDYTSEYVLGANDVLTFPVVYFTNSAPSSFTNSINSHLVDNNGTAQNASQSYAFFVIEDSSTSTNASNGAASAVQWSLNVLSGAGQLQSLSRNITATDQRQLLTFNAQANGTNSVLNSISFAISNTTTNSASFGTLALYRDSNSNGVFETGDVQLATTTNASGYAIFNGLTESLATNSAAYFLTASFNPSLQSQNSFINASLSPQQIIAKVGSSTLPATGASMYGNTYAFLDMTTAEQNAYALSLTNGLVTAGITNGFYSASTVDLLIAGATNNVGNTTVNKAASFGDTVIPAAAAGAAGIGAAFTSDSISRSAYSSEFAPPRP